MKIELKHPEELQGWTFTTGTQMSEVMENDLAEYNCNWEVKNYQNQEETVTRLRIRVTGRPVQYVYLTPASDPIMATWLVWDGVSTHALTEEAFDLLLKVSAGQGGSS